MNLIVSHLQCASRVGVVVGLDPAIHRKKDLISLWIEIPDQVRDARFARACLHTVFRRSGGIGGEPVPDPIPNSAVKLPCADGTKSQDLEE